MTISVSNAGPGNVPQDVVDEQDRLESLAATGLMDTPAEEGFDRITRLAQQLFGVSSATVTLVAQDRQFLTYQEYPASLSRLPSASSPAAAAACAPPTPPRR